MTNESFLQDRVNNLFGTTFDQRDGRVVPTTSDVVLKNGAVKIEAAFLYSDLAGSAKLSEACPWSTTAKVVRAFLDCATRLIIKHGGQVRSFDGDRVMGVFIGDSKNSNASICGREIHWSVRKVIQPAASKKFNSISDNGIEIRNCSGIDVGEVRAVRSGVRDSNDLIWIGKAASFSAKLSDVRAEGYCTYISSRTYNKLSKEAKFDEDGKNMWEAQSFDFSGKSETVYRSNHWKKP
ncbi:adenylate/guanylate cyclase domain-containing protein [Rhizobium leguminosarum]|uniref:adenylate/guanylate cyclase domain-containing protein n=1 Tax=Rhizobium leguminosarum TaxID=384 RepID=UPI001F1FE3DB|nr:adenylate/guanylate cyclase domain-containing protein [Rhizobium leguminosarum]UIK19397.1 adenylate/guanylate cyclase domain-containing protein [Rhizobium leguminosarum]